MKGFCVFWVRCLKRGFRKVFGKGFSLVFG